MPNLRKHCNSCSERYGYSFEEVHKWMDEPVKIATGHHRIIRHNYKATPKEAEEIFWDLVPHEYRSFIKHAVVDHLILDKRTESSKNKNNEKEPIYLPLEKPKNLRFAVFHLEKMRILCRRVERDLKKEENTPRFISHKFATFIIDHTRNSVKHYPPTEKVKWVKEIYKIIDEFEKNLWKINSRKLPEQVKELMIKTILFEIKDRVEEIIDEAYYNIEVTKNHEKASLKALAEMNSLDRIFTSAKEMHKE